MTRKRNISSSRIKQRLTPIGLLLCSVLINVQAQPFSYRFDSVPFGAEVIALVEGKQQVLGTTPLVYDNDSPLPSSIIIQKKGYKPQIFLLDPHTFAQTTIILEAEENAGKSKRMQWLKPTRKTWWIDALATSLVATGSVYSIRNKFKADDLFDQYAETGDPLLRPIIKKYDTKAGWGLATMQTGMTIIVVRLVLK